MARIGVVGKRIGWHSFRHSLIAEQAGGLATSGKEPILNVIPKGMHEKTPLVIGGRSEVKRSWLMCRGAALPLSEDWEEDSCAFRFHLNRADELPAKVVILKT